MNSKEYYEFISKFEERHTTDDCYTPPAVYDVVADYVAKEYNLNPDNFVRPFVPNGDYQAFEYAPDAVEEKAATTVWQLSDREREIIAGLGG